jgi:anti-anti-sigma factor
MFRITKAFENEATEIFRIEGKITDENLSEWSREINSIRSENGRHVILDLGQVWFISSRAVEALIERLSDEMYILNCGMEMRNILHASGLSAKMLE